VKADQVRKQVISLVPKDFTILQERDWLWVGLPKENLQYEDINFIISLGFQTSAKGRDIPNDEEGRKANFYHKCRFIPDKFVKSKETSEEVIEQQVEEEEEEEVDLLADII
jgi:hypothetical protein